MSLLAVLNLKRSPGHVPASPPRSATALPRASSNAAPATNGSAAASALSRDPDQAYNQYAALYNGINHLADKWEHPSASLDVSPSDPGDLVSAHRRLLQGLQQ